MEWILAILVVAANDPVPYLVTINFPNEEACMSAYKEAARMGAHPRIKSVAECGPKESIGVVYKAIAEKLEEDREARKKGTF